MMPKPIQITRARTLRWGSAHLTDWLISPRKLSIIRYLFALQTHIAYCFLLWWLVPRLLLHLEFKNKGFIKHGPKTHNIHFVCTTLETRFHELFNICFRLVFILFSSLLSTSDYMKPGDYIFQINIEIFAAHFLPPF